MKICTNSSFMLMGILCVISLLSIARCEYDLFDDIVNNPYRELRIAPWSSMSQVRQRYKELVKTYHPDKTKSRNAQEKFLEIQQAYERIKSARKSYERDDRENEDDDEYEEIDPMIEAISDALKIIIASGASLSLIYFVSWVCYRFYAIAYGPLFSQITSFVICDRLIPHYFKNFENQIIYSIVYGVLLFLFKKFLNNSFNRMFKKAPVKDSNSKKQ